MDKWNQDRSTHALVTSKGVFGNYKIAIRIERKGKLVVYNELWSVDERYQTFIRDIEISPDGKRVIFWPSGHKEFIFDLE
jgi:hypothetical protein